MKQTRNCLHPRSLQSLLNCVPPVTEEKQQAPSGSPCWQQAGSGFQIQEPAIQMGQFSLSASGRVLWSKSRHFWLQLGSSHCLARGRDCCHSVPALPPELQEAKEGLPWWSSNVYSAFPMQGPRVGPWSEN